MAATKTKKKKAGKNRSQAIREFRKAHPSAGPTEVATELTKMGLKVSPALVSAVKAHSAAKKKTGKKKLKRQAGGNVQMIAVSSLVEARKLAAHLGGIAEAQEALATLSKLQ